MILLIALFLMFGCIEISPKTADTNNLVVLDENTVIPVLPDPNLSDLDSQDELEVEPIDDVQGESEEEEDESEENEDDSSTITPPGESPPINPSPPTTPPPTLKKGWVELTVNTNMIDVYEGDFVEVNGSQSFSGMVFRIFVERILNTGTEFNARFRIETKQGLEMGKNTFEPGEEVSFEDPNGEKISYDALLVVERIFAG